MWRILASRFGPETTPNASPMRHRFRPKRRRNPDDGQKPRFYRCLSEERSCTEVTHGVHFAPGPCRPAIVEAVPHDPAGTRAWRKEPLEGASFRADDRCRSSRAPLDASSKFASRGRGSMAWRASAPAGRALFHHPRSCQAMVNATLTRASPRLRGLGRDMILQHRRLGTDPRGPRPLALGSDRRSGAPAACLIKFLGRGTLVPAPPGPRRVSERRPAPARAARWTRRRRTIVGARNQTNPTDRAESIR
jgi:hypothetical protein